MPRIPSNPGGTNAAFGQRGPDRPTQFNPDTRGITAGLDAVADAARTTQGVLLDQMQVRGQMQARQRAEAQEMANAKAFNAANDAELSVRTIVSDIESKIQDGSLPWNAALEEYEQRYAAREMVRVPELDPVSHERLSGQLQRQRVAGRTMVEQAVGGARRAEFRSQFDALLDTSGKLAGLPNSDIDRIHARAEEFVPLAEAAGLDEATIRGKLQVWKDRNWQNQATQRLLTVRDDDPGLAQLERDLAAEDGFYAGKLDADKRNLVLSQVIGRRDQLQRRTRDLTDKAEALAERALGQFEAQIASGVMAPIATMEAWQGALGGGTSEQRARFQSLIDGEAELRGVRKLPPVQQQEYLREQQAKHQRDGATTTQVSNLRRLETIVEGDLQRLRKSPLEHDAIMRGQAVEPLDLQALLGGDHDKVQAQFADRMVALTRIRKQYGPEAGNSPLLDSEATAIASALGQTDVRTAAKLFGVMGRPIADEDAYEAVIQQVTPDSPVRALAGRIYGRQRPPGTQAQGVSQASLGGQYGDVAMFLLKGEALLNPGKQGQGEDGKRSAFPMPPLERFDAEVLQLLGKSFAGRPSDLSVAVQGVRAYYAAKSADEGDVRGEVNRSRLVDAVRAVVGERSRVEGIDAMPPWGMSADDFEARAPAFVQARLKAAGQDDPGDVGLLNVRGRDGVYVLVRDMEPLVDARGMPLVIRMRSRR